MTPLYVVLLAFISLRITRQNMIPPSISQRRQVEGLWDLIGRYFTLSHTKNKIDCSSKAFGLCFDLTGVCMYLQKELANNPNCPHMCAYKLVTIKCPWYLKMLPSVVIQVWNHFFFIYYTQLWPIYTFVLLWVWNTTVRKVCTSSVIWPLISLCFTFSHTCSALCRWKRVCLPTSIDSCFAGWTNGSI